MTDENKVYMTANNTMPSDFNRRAYEHFVKAICKHPRFADMLFGNNVLDDAEYRLRCDRSKIAYYANNGWLDGTMLAKCEVAEATVAYLRGDKAATVDELYDAVAVLMRMIAVVEVKQRLGGEK